MKNGMKANYGWVNLLHILKFVHTDNAFSIFAIYKLGKESSPFTYTLHIYTKVSRPQTPSCQNETQDRVEENWVISLFQRLTDQKVKSEFYM